MAACRPDHVAAHAAEQTVSSPRPSTPTEHAQAQLDLQHQLSHIRHEVHEQLAVTPPRPQVELLVEEEKLAALQAELEALSAELQQV